MDELFESLRIRENSEITEFSNRAEEQDISLEKAEKSKIIGEVTNVEAQHHEAQFGAESLNRLFWDIPAARISRLEINNRPIVANYIAYTIRNIEWRAGAGWPIYSTPCPRDGLAGGGFWMPRARPHCTAMIVGNVGFGNCYMSGWARGNGNSNVLFGVNDDHYPDNSGGYRLYLDGWS